MAYPNQPGQPGGDEPGAFIASHRRIFTAFALALGLLGVLAAVRPGVRDALLSALTHEKLLVSLSVLFSLLMLSLVWSTGQALDALVFLYFNVHGKRPHWMDWFMWGATQIGNLATALLLAGVFYFLGDHRLSFEIILGMISLWIVVELIKALTERARPYHALSDARVVGWRERGHSFPSGHTSQTFFMMSLFIHYFQLAPWANLGLYMIATLVGITRIYVGAHYPRDVLAGAFLGIVWGVVVTAMDVYLVGSPIF